MTSIYKKSTALNRDAVLFLETAADGSETPSKQRVLGLSRLKKAIGYLADHFNPPDLLFKKRDLTADIFKKTIGF